MADTFHHVEATTASSDITDDAATDGYTPPTPEPQAPNMQPSTAAMVVAALVSVPFCYITIFVGGALWWFGQNSAKKLGKIITAVSAAVLVFAFAAVLLEFVALSHVAKQFDAGQTQDLPGQGVTQVSPPPAATDSYGNPVLADGTKSHPASPRLNTLVLYNEAQYALGPVPAQVFAGGQAKPANPCPNRVDRYTAAPPFDRIYLYDIKVDGRIVDEAQPAPHPKGSLGATMVVRFAGSDHQPLSLEYFWLGGLPNIRDHWSPAVCQYTQ